MRYFFVLFLALGLVSCATAPATPEVDTTNWQSPECATCAGRTVFIHSAMQVCPQVGLRDKPLYDKHLTYAKEIMGTGYGKMIQDRIAYFKEQPSRCEGVYALVRREPAYFGGMVETKGQ
jgi:hypothetical protein